MGESLPRLAVVYDPNSVDAMQFSRAANAWRALWVLDRATYATGDAERLLRRLGAVVHITGEPVDVAARLISAHKPDGIMAFTDAELPRTARLAHELGLPFFPAEVVTRLVNKAEQRRALSAAGLWVPAFVALPPGFETPRIREVANDLPFPVIVKPQTGASSRNTYLVKSMGHLEVVLDAVAGEPSGVVVEELMKDRWARDERPYADYVSVESLLSGGRVSHVMVTGRPTLAEPFRETGAFMPALLSVEDEQAVLAAASSAIIAIGADTGVFHTEIKLTPQGPRVIEVNGRLGGMIADLLTAAGGVSLLSLAASVALGDYVEVDGPVRCARVAYLLEIQAPLNARRLVRMDGLPDIQKLPGVAEVRANRRPSDLLDWRQGTEGCLFRVIGTARDHAAMWHVWQLIREVPTLVYESTHETVPD